MHLANIYLERSQVHLNTNSNIYWINKIVTTLTRANLNVKLQGSLEYCKWFIAKSDIAIFKEQEHHDIKGGLWPIQVGCQIDIYDLDALIIWNVVDLCKVKFLAC